MALEHTKVASEYSCPKPCLAVSLSCTPLFFGIFPLPIESLWDGSRLFPSRARLRLGKLIMTITLSHHQSELLYMLVQSPDSVDLLKRLFRAKHSELMYMYVNGLRASSRLVGPVSWLVTRSLCIIFLQLTPRANSSMHDYRQKGKVWSPCMHLFLARIEPSGFADPQGPKQESGRLKPPGFAFDQRYTLKQMETARAGSGSQEPVSGCRARLVSLAYNHGYKRNPNCPLCWRSNPSGQAKRR